MSKLRRLAASSDWRWARSFQSTCFIQTRRLIELIEGLEER